MKMKTWHPIRRLVQTITVYWKDSTMQGTVTVLHACTFSANVLYSLCQLCPERQRRKQEKTIAQQAKREQLKRLHRAQVLLSHSDPTNGSCCWHVQGLGIMHFSVSTSQNVWNMEKDWQNPQCPLSVTSLTALKKSSDGWIRLFSFNRVIFFSFLFSYNMNAVSLLLYVRFILGVLVHFFKKTLI